MGTDAECDGIDTVGIAGTHVAIGPDEAVFAGVDAHAIVLAGAAEMHERDSRVLSVTGAGPDFCHNNKSVTG